MGQVTYMMKLYDHPTKDTARPTIMIPLICISTHNFLHYNYV